MTKIARRERLFTQVAALPVRTADDGSTEVLLVTTRETRRWVIPKGWPMPGKRDFEAAATEAMEEAGVIGTIDPDPAGCFTYFKRRERHFDIVEVTAYTLHVTRQLEDWPERQEREVRWFRAVEAASLVQEPGLAALIQSLDRR